MEEMNETQAAQEAQDLEALQKKGKSFSIAGMVCAIVGLVLAFLGTFVITALLSLPCAIVGLVLSVIGGKKLKIVGASHGMAIAGLVVGIVATAISGIAFLSCGLCGLCLLSTAGGIASLF